jgi:hypothetical protein
MGRRIAFLQRRRWVIGAAINIALVVAIAVVVSGAAFALAAPGHVREVHPHADPRLIKLADGGRIIGFHAYCADMTDLGYIKDNECIDYLVVASGASESASAFQHDEVQRLDRASWRLFSPRDFGYSAPVVGRDDIEGHDCLLIGPPNRVPFGLEPPVGDGREPFWSKLRQALQRATRRGRAVIGMQMYPGPGNDAEHRVC